MKAIMSVIDMNASFGLRVDNDPDYQPVALAKELERHSVACALVYSQQGVSYDPRAGNSETLALAASNPAFIPVGVVNPKDSQGATSEIERCRAAGVKAFRFFPGEQGWRVDSVCFRRLLELFRHTRDLLIFDARDCPTGWEFPSRIALLTAALGVRVVLVNTTYGNMAEVMEVMKAYPHVYAETNWLATVGAVAIMAAEVGAGRLLYGSAAPHRSMQKALNQVLEAELSDADKIAILGGNALRLFGLESGNLPERIKGLPRLDSLKPRLFEDDEVIDVHSHLGYFWFPLRNEDYDPHPMLARMKRYNIGMGILSAVESMRYDIAAGNRKAAEAIAGHPQLRGYVELDPHHLELSCAEMDRYYQLPNCAGCELELSHIPCPVGSPKVKALLAEVAKRGKPILFLATYDSSSGEAERDLAQTFPDLSIIHAHGADAAFARAVKDAPNLYIEYCLSGMCPHHIRAGLDIIGPERILFGSDQNLLSPGGQIGLYLDARMNERERRLVLSGNARRIFKL